MAVSQSTVPIFERPLVSTSVACELLGIKRTTLFHLLGSGVLIVVELIIDFVSPNADLVL